MPPVLLAETGGAIIFCHMRYTKCIPFGDDIYRVICRQEFLIVFSEPNELKYFFYAMY